MAADMGQRSGFSSWWGRHSIAPDRTDFWQIGPLKLWLHNSPFRLALTWTHEDDFLDGHIRSVPGALDSNGITIETPASTAHGVHTLTCAYSGSARGDVVLSPLLPDRDVVVRLEAAISVLPNDDVTFYMVVPLWLRLELGETSQDGSKILHELPTYRLSDTWFGPMSTLGNLCYAAASDLFLDLRQVPLRPHCAITAVTIRNLGAEVLKLERLNIPFPRLSLFYSQRTGFWTDRLVLERRDDSEMAVIKLERQPPADASPTQFVTGPRQPESDSSSVVRAFSAIFRERGQ